MAIKGGKPIFLKAFLLVSAIFLLNVGYLAIKNTNLSAGLTGFSVKDTVFQSYSTMSSGVKIFLIAEWGFLFLILLFSLYKDRGMRKRKNETIDIHIKKNLEKNKTDLDTLYEILRDKKEISISTISKSFNVEKDIAMEWCKILESGELVVIDYPSFSEPVVKINEKEAKNINIERTNAIKDSASIKKEIEKPYIKSMVKVKKKKKISTTKKIASKKKKR